MLLGYSQGVSTTPPKRGGLARKGKCGSSAVLYENVFGDKVGDTLSIKDRNRS